MTACHQVVPLSIFAVFYAFVLGKQREGFAPEALWSPGLYVPNF